MYHDRIADDAQRPASPSKYSSEATDSPSKLNVPSRKARNQASNGIHDSEFYAEISTSLLTQVRNLQAIIAERDENVKTLALEKSRLEVEAEGFAQRLRSLDESEHRYKDENWSLETQTHELMANAKQAADREQRLNQLLSLTNAEKASAEKELDELRQANGKLGEDHSAALKHHEAEMLALRRDLTVGESERSVLQRKMEELDAQNQELAQAVASRMRHDETETTKDLDDDSLDVMVDNLTPEGSPPPSPSKGTPRHSMLESETLKSSLHHAHRMIQNLKGNIHREKTEKTELKRMLQEARDELELRRGDGGALNSAGKRKKSEREIFKKPAKPNLLGAGRNSKNEILLDEAGWEDHAGENGLGRNAGQAIRSSTRTGDVSESVNDGSDAFETANEREGSTTENDAFQTGAESLAGESSDELTETEGGLVRGGTLRAKPVSNPALDRAGNRNSFMSTASTSNDDEDERGDKTPSLPQQQRYRLKMSRNSAQRRSRGGDPGALNSSPSNAKDSPASFMSNSSQAAPPGQSLFSELGDLNGGESDGGDEEVEETPSRGSVPSRGSIGGSRPDTAKRAPANWGLASPRPVEMKDSGMMTEPWEPALPSPIPEFVGAPPIPFQLGDAHAPELNEHVSTDRNLAAPASDAAKKSMPVDSPRSSQATRAAQAVPSSVSSVGSQSQPDRVDVSQGQAKVPSLTFSSIHAQATEPTTPSAASPTQGSGRGTGTSLSAATSLPDHGSIDDQAPKNEPQKQGFFGSVFGWRKSQNASQTRIAEDGSSQEPPEQVPGTRDGALPFSDISPNIGERNLEHKSTTKQATETTDQAAQTLLSADQIENLLREKNRRQTLIAAEDGRRAAPLSPSKSQFGHAATPSLRSNRSQESISRPRGKVPEPGLTREEVAAMKSFKRPGSSGSIRNSSGAHPPLPPDHKEAIAAAAQRASLDQGSVMGPPLAPASAYRASISQRRPQTPSSQYQQSPSTRGGTTPRARYSASRGETASPVGTRRSSVSSFASELDERFNIRPDGLPMSIPQGLEGTGAGPRMIEAITQTMMGEFLWKYTRKTGRAQTSDKRHKRFFWVHPYNRTLYWSDRDPATAGRAELKAKSVAIQSVGVVTDDNPMPPGLHRKSIVIMTPGRSVKFTAITEQRHNTWFNALSYLLHRTDPEGTPARSDPVGQHQDLTAEDVDEFNPSYLRRDPSRGAASLSSYNSRTTRHTSPSRNAEMSRRSRVAPPSTMDTANSRHSQARGQTGSVSRFSTILRSGTALRGSFSSRKSRHSTKDSIYNASEVHDSAEDLREAYARQEREADRLENVRACCDGK